MTIREVTRKDVPSLVAIYKEYSPSDAEIIQNVYTKYYSSQKKNHFIKDFVYLDGDLIVGFSGFHKEETETKDIFWLNWTAVRKGYQRSGIARQLLNHMMQEIRALGGRKVYVSTESTNLVACQVYLAMGFTQEAVLVDYYEDGVDSIIFSQNSK